MRYPCHMPLRREEILGIQIRDINVELKTVTIRRAITFAANAHIDPITGKKISAGAAVVGLPKTEAGYRTIPITDSLWALLAITENELAHPDAYLVSRPDDPYNPYTSQTFKTLCNRYDHTQMEDLNNTRQRMELMYTVN